MRIRPAIVYSVLRILVFVVPFGLMMLFPIMREYLWLSAIFAALIGLSLSILFLRRPLEAATSGIAQRRAPTPREQDTAVEDAVADDLRDRQPQSAEPGADSGAASDTR